MYIKAPQKVPRASLGSILNCDSFANMNETGKEQAIKAAIQHIQPNKKFEPTEYRETSNAQSAPQPAQKYKL